MEQLGYKQDGSFENTGRTHSAIETEWLTPSTRIRFATFQQVGLDVVLHGYDNDGQALLNSPHDRWCRDLAELGLREGSTGEDHH